MHTRIQACSQLLKELISDDRTSALKSSLETSTMMRHMLAAQALGRNYLAMHNVKSSSMLSLLLSYDLDINQLDKVDRKTPLMSACFDARLEVVRSMIRVGANAKLRDVEGNTALHHFVNFQTCTKTWETRRKDMTLQEQNDWMNDYTRERFAVFKELVDVSDLSLKNRRGESVLHIAVGGSGFNAEIKYIVQVHPELFFELDMHGQSPLHWIFDVKRWYMVSNKDANKLDGKAMTKLLTFTNLCKVKNLQSMLEDVFLRMAIPESSSKKEAQAFTRCAEVFTDTGAEISAHSVEIVTVEHREALEEGESLYKRFKEIVNHQDNFLMNPLLAACDNAYLDGTLFQELLKLPVDVNQHLEGSGVLHHLAGADDLYIHHVQKNYKPPPWRKEVQKYVRKCIADRILQISIEMENSQFPRSKKEHTHVKKILECRDFKRYEVQPTIIAVKFDRVEFFEALMDLKIKVKLDLRTVTGTTALHFVHSCKMIETLEKYNLFLCDNDVGKAHGKMQRLALMRTPYNGPLSNNNALHMLCSQTTQTSWIMGDEFKLKPRHDDIVSLHDMTKQIIRMVELGARVNTTNGHGDTPLMACIKRIFQRPSWYSQRNTFLRTATIMIQQLDADPNMRNRDGKTVLQYLTEMKPGGRSTMAWNPTLMHRCVACNGHVNPILTYNLVRALLYAGSFQVSELQEGKVGKRKRSPEPRSVQVSVNCMGPWSVNNELAEMFYNHFAISKPLWFSWEKRMNFRAELCPTRLAITHFNFECRLALAMGLHPRLGADSRLKSLQLADGSATNGHEDVLGLILSMWQPFDITPFDPLSTMKKVFLR